MTAPGRRNRAILSLALVLLLGAALALLVWSRSGNRPDEESALTLIIGDQRGGAQALMRAAGELDGLPYPVKWALFPAASPLLEALDAGAIDLGGVGGAPFAFAYASGAKIKAVAAFQPSGPTVGRASAIVVPKASPLHTIADLKGKRLATIRGSAGQDLALRLLEKARVDPRSVHWVYLANGEAKAALEAGAIDAWSTWGSYVGIAVLENGNRVLADATRFPPSKGFFAASDKAIAAKRAQLGDFLARLARARQWGSNNRDAYARVLSAETKIPYEVARFSIDSTIGTAVPINDALVKEQEAVFARYRAAGVIPAVPDIAGAYDPSFSGTIGTAAPR
jgi:sulfonate transport system substrate-binding protein